MIRRASALLCLITVPALATPLWPTTAHAQAGEDATTEIARKRFQEGVRFYDMKQYEKARAAFLQAYALKEHPAVLLNLAQSELRSGHEADAAGHLAKYLRENADASAADRTKAEEGLTEAKAKVHELTVTSEKAAEIYLDGKLVGTAPLPDPIYLTPGSHTVEARKGGETVKEDVTAVAAQSTPLELKFGGSEVAPVGPVATPKEGDSKEGDPKDGATFEASTAGSRQPFVEWALESPIAWVGAGVTGLGLLGGIAFALGSKSSYDSADDVQGEILAEEASRVAGGTYGVDSNGDPINPSAGPCSSNHPTSSHFSQACGVYDDNVDDGDSQKTLSTVSFVVAGLGVATVVGGYFLFAPKKDEEESGTAKAKKNQFRADLVPVAGPGQGGLMLVGSF